MKDTPIEEIIEQMKCGQGLFVRNDIEVLHRKGRPMPTDCNGNKYETYALGWHRPDGNGLTENYLMNQFCQMILGKILSISCMKPEGEEVKLRPVSITWRMPPEITEIDNKQKIMSRCAFYVHNHAFDNGIFVN